MEAMNMILSELKPNKMIEWLSSDHINKNLQKISSISRYDLDDGNQFHEKASHVQYDRYIYFMFGAEDMIYWVILTDEEFGEKKSLSKIVRLGKILIMIV